MITVQNRLNSPTSINHPNFKNDGSSSVLTHCYIQDKLLMMHLQQLKLD